MRGAVTRPAIAPGQTWRAPDGTTRTVISVQPATRTSEASVRISYEDVTVTISVRSMRAWISGRKAVVDG